jgi:hypothetical protein
MRADMHGLIARMHVYLRTCIRACAHGFNARVRAYLKYGCACWPGLKAGKRSKEFSFLDKVQQDATLQKMRPPRWQRSAPRWPYDACACHALSGAKVRTNAAALMRMHWHARMRAHAVPRTSARAPCTRRPAAQAFRSVGKRVSAVGSLLKAAELGGTGERRI